MRIRIANPLRITKMLKLTGMAETATKTVGTRYPLDLIDLLDAITKRRGYASRADLIEATLNEVVESEFPGATRRDKAA